MKQIRLLSILAILALLVSCSSNEKNESKKDLVFKNDIDQTIGWSQNGTIVKCEAHSGKYAAKVDSTSPFSFGFSEQLALINDTAMKTIKYSAWVKSDKMPNKLSLVCSIDADGKSIAWVGKLLKEVVKKENEWTLVSGQLYIPANIPASSKVQVYLWSPEKEIGYVDDYEITFE